MKKNVDIGELASEVVEGAALSQSDQRKSPADFCEELLNQLEEESKDQSQ